MRIRVQLFAAARELAATDSLEVELAAGATVAELRQAIIIEGGEKLSALVDRAAIAVDAEYADNSTPVTEGADVALIPPVSGG
jgi:molybdopterin converting factor subunit 1